MTNRTRRLAGGLLLTAGAALWACRAADDAPPRGQNAADVLNASYVIEGLEVRLAGGRAEADAAPGSAAKIVTSAFGSPSFGDLDGDGDDDAALFLVQQPGGSGTFYYAAAAVNAGGAWRGTNAVLLGDRIAPQSVAVERGLVVANFAVRRPDEPLTAPPSMGRSVYLALKDGRLAEAAPPR